jgi:hypothetical protein
MGWRKNMLPIKFFHQNKGAIGLLITDLKANEYFKKCILKKSVEIKKVPEVILLGLRSLPLPDLNGGPSD